MEIDELLSTPLWQMTGSDFCKLQSYANALDKSKTPLAGRTLCASVHALAVYLNCCDATIYALRKEGVLDSAIVSQIGRRIVFDGEIARELASAYQTDRRNAHTSMEKC